MWKRLQNVYSQIKHTRLNPLSHPIYKLPSLHPVSYKAPTHRRILVFPVCVFIIGEGLLCHHKSGGVKNFSITPPDLSVPWQLDIPIVKDVFLTEAVIRDVRNWGFQKPPLKMINLCLTWWGSDWCLVWLIVKTHLFLKVILITKWLPWVFPVPCHFNVIFFSRRSFEILGPHFTNWCKSQLRLYFWLNNSEHFSLHVI